MAPREIRAANLLYTCALASLISMPILGGHLLGRYQLTSGALLGLDNMAVVCVAVIGILAGIIASPMEDRRRVWLYGATLMAMIGCSLLNRAYENPGWPRYAVLTAWALYLVVVIPLALRWFLGARRAAWSQVAAQP